LPWVLSFQDDESSFKIKVSSRQSHLFRQGQNALNYLNESFGFEFECLTLVAVSHCDELVDVLIVAFAPGGLLLGEGNGKICASRLDQEALDELVKGHEGLRIKVALLTYDLVCDINGCGLADNC
jgi:hypothetical protein